MKFYEKDNNIIFDFDVTDKESLITNGYVEKEVNFETAITSPIVKGIYIEHCKKRLEELRKDIVQEIAGLIIENIEDKKAEYRTLLNEVRVLQGKEPRKVN